MALSNPTRIATIGAATVVTGLVGYAVYFDYMRRNSADFRKGLRKQQKRVAAVAEARSKAEKEKNTKALREMFAEISREPTVVSPEQQEAYFQEQVAEGEKLATMGDEFNVRAAGHFFRALRVYPNPIELLGIYQRVVPPTVFALVIELMSMGPAGAAGGQGASAAIPPQPVASVADIDDSAPDAETEAEVSSPNGTSQGSGTGSGTEWERVSEEAV